MYFNHRSKIFLRIPGFHSASLMFALIKYFGDALDLEELAPKLKDSPLLPLISPYLLNEVDKKGTDFRDREELYYLLSLLGEPRLFAPLRKELLEDNIGDWASEEMDTQEIATFYEEIARHIIRLGDRRGVPVFIKVLSGGGAKGIPGEAREAIGKLLKKESPWYEEIVQGLKLVREGETVFVERGAHPTQMIVDDAGEYQKFHNLATGRELDLPELNKRLEVQRQRLNEAYHEDLDGLRPVDIDIPAVKKGLMERMFRELQAAMKGREETISEKAMAEVQKFQSEWLVTPLADHNGELPIVIALREEKAAALTFAGQEHFRKYLAEKISTLYLEARDLFQDGKMEAARKRLDAILQIEPGHPFAEALRKRTGIGPQEQKDTKEDESSRETRTNYLKPILSDVLLQHRPALEKTLEQEIASLKEKGVSGPLFDDSRLLFLNDYIIRTIKEHKKEEFNLSDQSRELELLAMTVDLEYFALLNFRLFGEKVFYLAPKLVERLMETELDVPGSLLKTPFPSCALVYQDPQFIQLFHECFVETRIVPEYETPVTVFLAEQGMVDTPRTLVIVAARVSSDFRYYGIARRGLLIRDSQTIEEALRTEWKDVEGDAGKDPANAAASNEQAQDDSFFYSDSRMTFFRTILNSLLYLSSCDPDITRMISTVGNIRAEMKKTKSEKHRKKLQQQLGKKQSELSAHEYIFVGKNLEKSKLHKHYLREDVKSWRTIMGRFMVRGHWKHQACGKELKERRLIWIQPYWKGPLDISEVIGKPYIAE